VAEPQHVTYAFDDFAQAANLANADGIPASPFRTAKPNDTVSNQDKSSTRFTAQDWMYADRDVWVYDETNTADYKYGYRPSFAVESGDYSYDTVIKAEGIASLRVEFDRNFLVSLILTYPQTAQKWGKYKTLSVKLLNPSATAVELSMTLTSGGKTYDVPPVDGGNTVTLTAGGTAFHVYTFALDQLTLKGVVQKNPAALLNAVSGVTFHGVAEDTGTLFFDGFSFGLTAPTVTDAAVNAAATGVLASFDDLLAAIREAEMIDPDLYTIESATWLEIMLEKAHTTYSAAPLATPLAVTDATAALKNAIAALEPLPPSPALLGDVNGDTVVNSTDARLTLQYAVQKIRAEGLDLACADVDGNGAVNSTDARLILQYAVMKIDKLPAAK